jgi:hypothetical protein
MKSRERKSPKKKSYHRPRLLVYGDLRTVTQTIGTSSKWDNAAKTLMAKS